MEMWKECWEIPMLIEGVILSGIISGFGLIMGALVYKFITWFMTKLFDNDNRKE